MAIYSIMDGLSHKHKASLLRLDHNVPTPNPRYTFDTIWHFHLILSLQRHKRERFYQKYSNYGRWRQPRGL
jgi:hypothetical protein